MTSINKNNQNQTHTTEVIDLGYLSSVLIKWSWIPILFALAGIYSGYSDLKGFTPQYVAAMTVLPSESINQGKSSGGVEAIAVELGLLPGAQASSISPFNRLEFFLGSVSLADRLQKKYGIMQLLYSGSWDDEEQEWKKPSGEEFERQEKIKTFLRQNLWTPPNLQNAANFIVSSIKIEEIDGGPFKRLSVTHQDPDFALWLLTTAYFEADELIRETDKLELEERMAYVEKQLATVDKIHIRDGLREQLATELGRAVALEVDLPYSATVVEEAYILNGLTEPNIRLIFGMPGIIGGVIGFILISLFALIRRERNI